MVVDMSTCAGHAESDKPQSRAEVTRPIENKAATHVRICVVDYSYLCCCDVVLSVLTRVFFVQVGAVEKGCVDFYALHFEKVITCVKKEEFFLQKSKRLKQLETAGWQPSQLRRNCRIEASSAAFEQGRVDAPMHLQSYGETHSC